MRYALNSLLIVLFGLLHIADGVVTYLGLRFAGLDEVNPVLNYFVGLWGLGYSISLLKLLFIAVLASLFCARHKMKSGWNTTTLACAVAFYCWVVSNNMDLVVGA